MLTILGIDIGIRNFSMCILRRTPSNSFQILDWDNINLLRWLPHRTTCNKVTMSDIHLLMNTVIPEIWQTRCQPHQVQHIAIEQQPQGKYANTKMIILSHLLVHYFQEHIATGPHLVTCRLVSAGKNITSNS